MVSTRLGENFDAVAMGSEVWRKKNIEHEASDGKIRWRNSLGSFCGLESIWRGFDVFLMVYFLCFSANMNVD